MDRQAYNECMRPYITGSKPAEERKLDFCVGAKICSGKAKDREEAVAICSMPKEPKEPKARKTRGKANCGKEMGDIAFCLAPLLNTDDDITISRLTEMLQQCACGGKVEKPSREKFIKQCFKENSSTGNLQIDIKEAQKLRSLCTAKYKEQEAK